MNPTPADSSNHAATTLVAAAAAAVISLSRLGGVATLFLNAGTPSAQTRFAAQTCAGLATSKRSDCTKALFAASKNPGVAGR